MLLMSGSPDHSDETARRRSVRRSVPRITVRFESPRIEGLGYLKNVSRDGLFVRTAQLPAPGELVRVIFQDPQKRWIEVSGTVRWNTLQIQSEERVPAGVGMRIDDVSEGYKTFFRALLDIS